MRPHPSIPLTGRTATAGRTRTGVTAAALALAASLALGACSGQGTGDAASASTPDAASSTSDAASSTSDAGTTVDTEALPDPVAAVNGTEISRADFVTAFEPQREASQQQAEAGGAPVDEVALRDSVLDVLVGAELLAQEGERLGLEATEEEIDAELDALAEESSLASGSELLTMLGEQGLDETQVREEVGRLVVMDEILAERGGAEPVTDQDVRDYYDEMTGGDDAAATAGMPAYDDVKDLIQQQLTQQKEDEVLTAIVQELKQDAEITSYL